MHRVTLQTGNQEEHPVGKQNCANYLPKSSLLEQMKKIKMQPGNPGSPRKWVKTVFPVNLCVFYLVNVNTAPACSVSENFIMHFSNFRKQMIAKFYSTVPRHKLYISQNFMRNNLQLCE